VVLVKAYPHDCMASAARLWIEVFQYHIWSCQHPVHVIFAHVELLDVVGFPDSAPSVNATLGFERSDCPSHIFFDVHNCKNHQHTKQNR